MTVARGGTCTRERAKREPTGRCHSVMFLDQGTSKQANAQIGHDEGRMKWTYRLQGALAASERSHLRH